MRHRLLAHMRYGSACLLALLLLSMHSVVAQERPKVDGYGVHLCEAYLQAFTGSEMGQEEQIAEYLRYREWLSGFTTGLSLTTGMDVLHGVEVAGALRRIQIYCDEHPTEDFFNATLELLKQLSKL